MRLILISGLFLFACALAPVLEARADTLQSYYEQIDESCNVDADCYIANVGNCCGYYPACINVASIPDPDRVHKICEQLGVAGVCGFPEIERCVCVEGKCQPVNMTGSSQ